jgi:hypothetical protein
MLTWLNTTEQMSLYLQFTFNPSYLHSPIKSGYVNSFSKSNFTRIFRKWVYLRLSILITKYVMFSVGYKPQTVHSVKEITNLGPTGLDSFSHRMDSLRLTCISFTLKRKEHSIV